MNSCSDSILQIFVFTPCSNEHWWKWMCRKFDHAMNEFPEWNTIISANTFGIFALLIGLWTSFFVFFLYAERTAAKEEFEVCVDRSKVNEFYLSKGDTTNKKNQSIYTVHVLCLYLLYHSAIIFEMVSSIYASKILVHCSICFKNDLLVYKISIYKPDVFYRCAGGVNVTIKYDFSAILHGNIEETSLNLRVKKYDHSFDGAMDEVKP